MSKIEVKESGRFIDHIYFLHLKPLHRNREMVTHHFTDIVKRLPCHGNGGTYKEIKPLERKENKESVSQNSNPQKTTQLNLGYNDYLHRIKSDRVLGLSEREPLTYLEWLALYKP